MNFIDYSAELIDLYNQNTGRIKVSEDYNDRLMFLIRYYSNEIWHNSDWRLSGILIDCCSVKGLYNVIPILIERARDLVCIIGDLEGRDKQHAINDISDIGYRLETIGFQKDKLNEYSEFIHKNICIPLEYSENTISYLYALSKYNDNATHCILKEFLKQGKNINIITIDSIGNYKDISDLDLIDKYRHKSSGYDWEIRMHAERVFKKINKSNK